jgi:phage tail-like protein
MAESSANDLKLTEHPIVGFHFQVTVPGNTVDMHFQSVAGLSAQVQTESFKEGGEHRFEHTLPVRMKYGDLVLKRGILTRGASELTKWFQKAMEDFQFTPWNFTVQLLDENHQTLLAWNINHALPKDWKVNDLNAERGEILIESLTMSYSYFTFR